MGEEVAEETRAATARRGLFFRARVLVLVTVLLSVVLYAVTDVRRRRGRNEWDHTLEIAVVLLASRPVAPGAVAALQARVPTLEARLAAEGERYRAGMPRPFRFRVSGPFVTDLEAPRATGGGVAELAQHAWATRQYTRAIDEGAGVDRGSYDARIYVRLRPPESAKKAWVEGQSEQGGWVGQVDVELDERMVDVALAVIALPHPKWQERPLACVVPKPDFKESLTKDEILEHLKSRFTKMYLPDDVVFIEAVPKTSVGKFDKKVLRVQFKDHKLPD